MQRPHRATRELTAEELELWRIVTANVRPRALRPAVAAVQPGPARRPSVEPTHGALEHRPPPTPAHKKPLLSIDRRQKRDLAKGRLEIDARLDLHGWTTAEAHRRVHDFLIQAQRDGARVVLIVTGKGSRAGPADGWSGGEVGALKRQTPLWLADPRLRHVVGAFGEAAAGHGGGGALYVRLRRGDRR